MIANRYFQIGHFHSSVLDVYYLHLWKHYIVFTHMKGSHYFRFNLSRTQLWDCWGISHCYLYSSVLDVYYLHLWKHYFVYTQMKGSLYFRYNLSWTQLWDCWGIFTLYFHTTVLYVYYLYLWRHTMYFYKSLVHFTIDVT